MSHLFGDPEKTPSKDHFGKGPENAARIYWRAPFPSRPSVQDKVCDAIRRTHSYYQDQQHSLGYWWYELESNVTITSEYLMLMRFLGLEDDERDSRIAKHIFRNQRDDGTWALYYGGPGDLSATVEAYFALKLAGYSPADARMRKAREFILAKGGVEASRVFTKFYLALFGEFDWRGIPSIPVEINLLPAWFPFSIYEFSSWARSTLVPLSMVAEYKPLRKIPEAASIRELYKDPSKALSITPNNLSAFSWKRAFIILDKIIKAVERTDLRPLKDKALRRTERWVLDHQDHTGDWGGIQPAMVNSILALSVRGYSVDSAPVRKGLEALEAFTIENGDELILQSCVSPVWDTALTSLALIHSGMDRSNPCLERSCKWLASKQIFKRGDWSIKRPGLEPGGWAFEMENSWYPDVDDSAVVLQFLSRYSDRDFIRPENLEKGLKWILGMQGSDGGWGAFDADNNMKVLNQLPFGDLEAMIDPSTSDLTGRVLELLGMMRFPISDIRVRRALGFIRKNQEKNGSWWGRWGVNYLYGTSAVLSGLDSIGEDMSAPYVRKAVGWLKSTQNTDGGWGEDCGSYKKTYTPKPANSTASQTAWALMALMAAGEERSDEALRGIGFLLENQNKDGTWDEEEYTGTGFPNHFYIRYHNYRNCFPLMALGKFQKKTGEGNR